MIILVGPSASGKTEIGKLLTEYGYKKLVTYTTREKRVGEVDKIDYNFISVTEFLKLQNENFFFETVKYNDNYYGTSIESINHYSYVILEPSGLLKYKYQRDVYSFYIDVPENILLARMIGRKDKREDITKRVLSDKHVFNDDVKKECDYVLDGTKPLEMLVKEILEKVNNGLH